MSTFSQAKCENMMLVINMYSFSSEIFIYFPFNDYKSQTNGSETIQQLCKYNAMLSLKI